MPHMQLFKPHGTAVDWPAQTKQKLPFPGQGRGGLKTNRGLAVVLRVVPPGWQLCPRLGGRLSRHRMRTMQAEDMENQDICRF